MFGIDDYAVLCFADTEGVDKNWQYKEIGTPDDVWKNVDGTRAEVRHCEEDK